MQNSICLYFGSWNFNNRKQTVYNTNGFLNRKYHCNEIFGASKNSLTLWNLNVPKYDDSHEFTTFYID